MSRTTVPASDTSAAPSPRDGFWLRIIYIVSILISAAVAFLILGPRPSGTRGALDVSMLPTVNASLNALTAVLLLAGLWLVKNKRIAQHKNVMLAAFASSSGFLISYIIYHWFKAAPQPYLGAYRGIYLAILFSHIVLAALIIPLALITLYRGWTMTIAKHRKIAKVTLPIWLYVSVTGVLIYLMLYG